MLCTCASILPGNQWSHIFRNLHLHLPGSTPLKLHLLHYKTVISPVSLYFFKLRLHDCSLKFIVPCIFRSVCFCVYSLFLNVHFPSYYSAGQRKTHTMRCTNASSHVPWLPWHGIAPHTHTHRVRSKCFRSVCMMQIQTSFQLNRKQRLPINRAKGDMAHKMEVEEF